MVLYTKGRVHIACALETGSQLALRVDSFLSRSATLASDGRHTFVSCLRRVERAIRDRLFAPKHRLASRSHEINPPGGVERVQCHLYPHRHICPVRLPSICTAQAINIQEGGRLTMIIKPSVSSASNMHICLLKDRLRHTRWLMLRVVEIRAVYFDFGHVLDVRGASRKLHVVLGP